eukprot:14314762-Alexandrium_andersonii.AAC.1
MLVSARALPPRRPPQVSLKRKAHNVDAFSDCGSFQSQSPECSDNVAKLFAWPERFWQQLPEFMRDRLAKAVRRG